MVHVRLNSKLMDRSSERLIVQRDQQSIEILDPIHTELGHSHEMPSECMSEI
jgi:hypothetical protein